MHQQRPIEIDTSHICEIPWVTGCSSMSQSKEWCQFLWAIVDTHATHLHRMSIEVKISTVKTYFASF